MAENKEQWVPIDFRVIGSQWFDETPGEIIKFYIILRRYVCRARSGHSLSDYYRKGMLTTGGSLRNWTKKMGKSPQTVGRYIKYLEDTRALHVHRKARNETEPTILVLGRVIWTPGSEKGTEMFFLDHLSTAQDPVAEMPCVTGNELGLLYAETDSLLNMDSLNSAVPPMERQIDSAVPSAVPPMEHRIEKNNREGNTEEEYSPPIGGGLGEPEYVPLDEDGFPETPKSAIVRHIRDMGKRKLTPNQEAKLDQAIQVGTTQHSSPRFLFEHHSLFPAYVDDKIAWAQGSNGEGKRMPNGSLVSAIRNYNTEKYGWLDWLAVHTEEDHETAEDTHSIPAV